MGLSFWTRVRTSSFMNREIMSAPPLSSVARDPSGGASPGLYLPVSTPWASGDQAVTEAPAGASPPPDVKGKARFELPADLERFGVTRERLLWDRAELRMGASDARVGLMSEALVMPWRANSPAPPSLRRTTRRVARARR